MLSNRKRTKVIIVLLLTLSLILFTFLVPLANATDDYWTTLTSMPSAVDGQRIAVANGKIYVIAGSINYEYDPATDTWTAKMPTPRFHFGIAVYQNKIYIIGGTNEFVWSSDGTIYTRVNEAYDPTTDTWETKAQMPTNRSAMQTTVVNGKIYVMGGKTDYDPAKAEVTFCAINEAYDPLTNTWESKNSMPTKKRNFDANVVDSMIYCIGGYPNQSEFEAPSFPAVLDRNEVYDTTTDSWTTKAPIPIPVYAYQSVVLDNKIYILTGGPYESNYNQIYDAQSDTWSSGENLPTTIRSAAVVATSGNMAPKRIYVIGGFTGFVTAVNTTYVYDPEADEWSEGAQMPTSRYGVGVAVINDILYAIGGALYFSGISDMTAAVEQYTPVGYIPEFPSWIILPIFLIVTLLASIFKKRYSIKSLEN